MIRNTILYAISVAFMRGISLIMLPFVAHHLSPEELGKVEILATLAILGSVLVGMGLEQALYRFAGQADENKRHQVAAIVFTLAIIICIVSLTLLKPLVFLIQPIIPGNVPHYCIGLVLSILAFESLISVPLGWLRMQNKVSLFCTLSIMRVVIYAVMIFILLKSGRGMYGVFEANAVAVFSQAFLLFLWQINNTGIYICLNTIKKIVSYSTPIVGSGLLAFFLVGFDRWCIADQLNISTVAIYGIAAKFSIALTMLLQPYGMWWMPKRFEVLRENQGKEKVTHYSIMGLLILLFLGFTLGLISPIAIHILLPETFKQAIPFALGLILTIMLKEAVEFVNMGCFLKNRTDIQLKINLSATAFASIGIIIGIQLVSLWGVVIALFLSHAIRLILFYHFSQKTLHLNIPTLLLIKLYTIILMSFLTLIIVHYKGFELSYFLLCTFILPFLSLVLGHSIIRDILKYIDIPSSILNTFNRIKVKHA